MKSEIALQIEIRHWISGYYARLLDGEFSRSKTMAERTECTFVLDNIAQLQMGAILRYGDESLRKQVLFELNHIEEAVAADKKSEQSQKASIVPLNSKRGKI